MTKPYTAAKFDIALVDEDYSTRRLLDLTISRSWGYRIESFGTLRAYLAQTSDAPDVLLFGLPAGCDEPAAMLLSLQRRFPGLPVVLLCSKEENETAAALLGMGAWDYFTRPVDLLRLRAVLQRITDVRQLLERIAVLEDRLERRWHDHADAGESDSGFVLTMDEAKEHAIRRALRASGGNVKEAARLLGIGRTTIYKLMEKFNLRHRTDETI